MKSGHAKKSNELTQCKYGAEVVYNNAIAQAEVTHQVKVKELVQAHTKEGNILTYTHTADLSELCCFHKREIKVLKRGFDEIWTTFCERKEREKFMMRRGTRRELIEKQPDAPYSKRR
jgi:hypothetical protein